MYNAAMFVENWQVTDVLNAPSSQARDAIYGLENQLLHGLSQLADAHAVHTAIVFATACHGDQQRNTGEPQMVHPLRAMTYAQEALGVSSFSIKLFQVIALHDVIEDTTMTRQALAVSFGEDVAQAVDILSKKRNHIFKPSYRGKRKQHRYFLDLRFGGGDVTPEVRELVFCAKLADRLENMKTLRTLAAKPSRRGTWSETEQIQRQIEYIHETRTFILPLLPETHPLHMALVEATLLEEKRLRLAA